MLSSSYFLFEVWRSADHTALWPCGEDSFAAEVVEQVMKCAVIDVGALGDHVASRLVLLPVQSNDESECMLGSIVWWDANPSISSWRNGQSTELSAAARTLCGDVVELLGTRWVVWVRLSARYQHAALLTHVNPTWYCLKSSLTHLITVTDGEIVAPPRSWDSWRKFCYVIVEILTKQHAKVQQIYLIVDRFACKQFSALHSVAADVFSEGLLWQCVFTFVRLESATRPTCESWVLRGTRQV